MGKRERGQVVPLLAAVVVVVALCLAGLSRLGRTALDRASARTAADAAALAGAVDGEAEARSVAAANGGRLVRFSVDGAEVEVRVVVGQASAVARARAERGDADGGPLGAVCRAARVVVPRCQAAARAVRPAGGGGP